MCFSTAEHGANDASERSLSFGPVSSMFVNPLVGIGLSRVDLFKQIRNATAEFVLRRQLVRVYRTRGQSATGTAARKRFGENSEKGREVEVSGMSPLHL